MPFCSSESAGRSEPATSPTSWARLRSAVFGAQRFGIVTSSTASSGTDSIRLQRLLERQQLDLGIDLGPDVRDVGGDQDEDGEEAEPGEHEQQQAAALAWIHRN